MTKTSYDIWKNVRKQGKKKYILCEGLLKFALPIALLMSFLSPLLDGNNISYYLTSSCWTAALFNVVFYSPLGLIYGWITWVIRESQYSKYEKKDQ